MEHAHKLMNGMNGNAVIQTPTHFVKEDFLRISICGVMYDVLESTLQRYPNTLLGNRERRQQYYVKWKDAYYFDCNRQTFEAILYYYQSRGTLIRPNDLPQHSFDEEVAFFGLDEEEDGSTADETPSNKEHYFQWQGKLWDLFEFPDSGPLARIIALWSLFVIAVSITIFCMETMPVFKVQELKRLQFERQSNSSYNNSTKYNSLTVWFSLELGCIVWFTLEYMTRLVSSPNKLQFFKSILNMIDLAAILPYFITVCNPEGGKQHLSILRIVRLVRVFRIFKLSRYSNGLRILGETLKASISELAMLVFFLFLGVLLFSSAMYYAEEGASDNFKSIPDSFWYSVVTMTTVGYGDLVPQTLFGKIIGTLCALSGVLTIALPVPVIVSNFDYFYKRDLLRKQKKELEKKGSAMPYCEVRVEDILDNKQPITPLTPRLGRPPLSPRICRSPKKSPQKSPQKSY